MAAAQTKGHEEDKHTGMQEKIRQGRKEKRKTESRKQGTKASKQESRTHGVSISTNLPVTAAAVAPPPREQINENQTNLPGLGGCSNSGSTY